MKIPRKNKFNAKKAVLDGFTFDSLMERDYYLVLKHQEKQGLIKIIELQPKIYLSDAKILYKSDFLIQRLGSEDKIYIDVKGVRTPVFNIKARLFAAYTSDVLEIVKKKGRNFFLEKSIQGKK